MERYILFIIIFALVIVVALVVVFILFIVKGARGASEDKSLYEKGLISKEQYDSGFNQSTTEVVNESYAQMRREKQARQQQRQQQQRQQQQQK